MKAGVKTGIPGLDAILTDFARGYMFLIEGESGTGKTMLGMAFAANASANGESVVYITLSETRGEIENIAASHGWDFSKVQIIEGDAGEPKYTLFHPSDVELDEVVKGLMQRIELAKPTCVIIDSLAEIRLMTQSSLQYRRELMSLKRYFGSLQCTVLLLDELEASKVENRSPSIVDGVLVLEQLTPDYGGVRRRLKVRKYRDRGYTGGYHDFLIGDGGLEVFPRLIAAEHRTRQEPRILHSGIAELDAMLGGGLLVGTSTLLVGPAGVGKSSTGLRFVLSAAERGESAAIYNFDERPELTFQRAKGLGMDLEPHVHAGRVHIRQVDPVDLSPGQFAESIRDEAEKHHATVVMIDSLNGYMHAMPEERFLVAQMHELLTYMGQQSVSTFLVMGQVGVLGLGETPANTSYLTDNVLLLRFFESEGVVRRSISVVKKRTGGHEHTIRELSFASDGLHIGQPLSQFHGVLSGTPQFTGASEQLLTAQNAKRKRE
jgi:circadian clock protein KaiC